MTRLILFAAAIALVASAANAQVAEGAKVIVIEALPPA